MEEPKWWLQLPITNSVMAWPEPRGLTGRSLLYWLLLAAFAAPWLSLQAATVQCWKNDAGQRICGDAVPPSEVRRQRELVDQRGITQKVLPAQKSAAEVEVEARTQREREQALAYDHYLLQSYTSVADIERTRDERITALDGRLRLAEKALGDTETTLADLNRRVAAEPKLRPRIDEFNAAKIDHAGAMKRIRGEREKVSTDFARDIQRYRELRPAKGN